MFYIDENLTIHITRGDMAVFNISAAINGGVYTFKKGDVVRFNVFGKKDCEKVVLQKDVTTTERQTYVVMPLSGEDTKIGEWIVKPTDYWYEVELNPDTEPQTIIGYDENGAKIFKVYPEGGGASE